MLLPACNWYWPKSNPLDPLSCDPECAGSLYCREGRCVEPDAQVGDGPLNADAPRHESGAPDAKRPPDTRADAPPQVKKVQGPFVISAAPMGQSEPAVGANKSAFMVVWQDFRNNASKADIYGARVKIDGSVYETSGIPMAMKPGSKYKPSVASTGGDYLVAWSIFGSNAALDIQGVKVQYQGWVAPAEIAICTAQETQEDPQISWDGSAYQVVWEDQRGGYLKSNIYGARIDKDGKILKAEFPITQAQGAQADPSVACSANGCLVVWLDMSKSTLDTDILGAWIDKSGQVLKTDIPITKAAGRQRSPSVAYDGGTYLVVWEDQRNGKQNEDIYGARLGNGGTILKKGFPICTVAGKQYYPSAAGGGGFFLVAWFESSASARNIRVARVTNNGIVWDHSGIALSKTGKCFGGPSVASVGSTFLVAWTEDRNTGSKNDLYGALVIP